MLRPTSRGTSGSPSPDSQHMLELEALQISQQSHDIERLLIEFNLLDPKVANDPQIVLSPQVRQVVEALLEHPTISQSLKRQLASTTPTSVLVSTPKNTADDKSAPPPDLPPPSNRVIAPDVPAPPKRRLWVYARDPLQGNDMGFFDLNQVEL